MPPRGSGCLGGRSAPGTGVAEKHALDAEVSRSWWNSWRVLDGALSLHLITISTVNTSISYVTVKSAPGISCPLPSPSPVLSAPPLAGNSKARNF